jgi:hypothetical protein
MKRYLSFIALLLICGLLQGQRFTQVSETSEVHKLPEQKILTFTPAPHSPARNPGRAHKALPPLVLYPVTHENRAQLPQRARSRVELMGYETYHPPLENAYVSGELCLEFYDLARGVVEINSTGDAVTTGIAEMDILNAQHNATDMQRLISDYLLPSNAIEYRLDLMYVITMDATLDMEQVAAEYRAQPLVKCAHPNYIPYRTSPLKTYPDDPGFDWAPNITQGPEAWSITTGSWTDTLGIIDIDQFHDGHVDLDGTYAGVAGGTSPLGTGSWHGTACIGHGCAELNNAEGIASSAGGWGGTGGILWMPYRITSAADNANAVSWMVTNGACVISQSVLYTANPEILEDAFASALDNDVLSFVSSGNDNNDNASQSWPAYFDCVVAVGGIDKVGRHWAWSPDTGSCYGEWVDITGPADAQFALDTNTYVPNHGGTSMATPRVAGIAALVANQTGLRGEALREVLLRTTDDGDYLNENLYSYGATPYGFTGAGRINAYEAIMYKDKNLSVDLIRLSSDLNPYVNAYGAYLDYDAQDSLYGSYTHSLVPGVAVTPEAFVQNRGISEEGGNLHAGATQGGYIDDKLQDAVDPGQGEWEHFGDYAPESEGECTLTVYCDLAGDENNANDTFSIILNVSYTDTVQFDGGLWTAAYEDGWAAWAVYFIPERLCTLTAIQVCAEAKNAVGEACTLAVWSAATGAPGDRMWTRAISMSDVVDGWNTFAGFTVVLDQPVFIGMRARGADATASFMPCVDERWNSGRSWFSASGGTDNATDWIALGQDIFIRPVVQYTPVRNSDICLLSIDAPPASVFSGTSQLPRATVHNCGTTASSFNTVFRIDSAGTTVYTQSVMTTDLAPHTSSELVWPSGWVPNWDGTYNMTVYTELIGDEYRANDTLHGDIASTMTRELDAGEGDVNAGSELPFYFAVRFEPDLPCSVVGARFCIDASNPLPAALCSLYVWTDDDGEPGTPVRGPIAFTGFPYEPSWCTVNITNPFYTEQPFWLGAYSPGVVGSGARSVTLDDENPNGRSMYNVQPFGTWSATDNNCLIHALIRYDCLNEDAGIVSIDVPRGSVMANFAVIPKVTIENRGRQTMSGFSVQFVIDSAGHDIYTSIQAVTSLLPTESRQISFEPWTPIQVMFNYKKQVALVSAMPPLDDNPLNDTLSDTTRCTDLTTIAYHDDPDHMFVTSTKKYGVQRFTPELPCSLVGAWIGLTAPAGWGLPCSTFVFNEAQYDPPRDWPGTLVWQEEWTPTSSATLALFRRILPTLYYNRGQDFYIGAWAPSDVAGPHLLCDDRADHGRSWYDADRDSVWWDPLGADWAIQAIVKYLGGEAHTVRGWIKSATPFSDDSLHLTSYLLKNPEQSIDETSTGSAIAYCGNNLGLWQVDCRYFWPNWTWRDRLMTVIDYETGSGTTGHTGFYGVMIDTLLLETNPQDAPACSLRQIPVPTWSILYWWSNEKVVQFTWNMPATDAGNPDTSYIAGYNVYRSTDGVNFSHLRTLQSADDTTFNDTVLPPYTTYYYAIKLIYSGTTFSKDPVIESRYLSAHTMVSYIGISEQPDDIPVAFALSPAHPNPSADHTLLKYALPKATRTKLQVFDICGRLVMTLVDELKEPGYYTVSIEKGQLASGIYFCRFSTDDFTASSKFIFAR